MKDKLKNIFLIVLLLMFVGYLLITGIYDLINTKDRHTVNIDECYEFLVIEHSINGLIPVGKDYYYLGIDVDSNDAVIVKAPKNWYGKNFDADGNSVNAGGLTFEALAKKASYDVERELVSRTSQIEGLNYLIPANYSLEVSYRFNAISKLVLLVLAAVLGIVGYVFSKSPNTISGSVRKIYLVAIIVFLVLLLKVII